MKKSKAEVLISYIIAEPRKNGEKFRSSTNMKTHTFGYLLLLVAHDNVEDDTNFRRDSISNSIYCDVAITLLLCYTKLRINEN
jgi:hypothetical protein